MARQRAAKVSRVVTVTASCPYCQSENVGNTDDGHALFHEEAREGSCRDCGELFFVPVRVFFYKD